MKITQVSANVPVHSRADGFSPHFEFINYDERYFSNTFSQYVTEMSPYEITSSAKINISTVEISPGEKTEMVCISKDFTEKDRLEVVDISTIVYATLKHGEKIFEKLINDPPTKSKKIIILGKTPADTLFAVHMQYHQPKGNIKRWYVNVDINPSANTLHTEEDLKNIILITAA